MFGFNIKDSFDELLNIAKYGSDMNESLEDARIDYESRKIIDSEVNPEKYERDYEERSSYGTYFCEDCYNQGKYDDDYR